MKTKHLLPALLLITLLTGCKENKRAIEPATQKEFDLTTLPQDWVRLTKTDSGYVVFNSCDAGNLLLTISTGKNAPTLLLHGQQEDYEFNILKSYSGGNDTIMINGKWKGAEQKQDFKFVWENKTKKLGRWITTYDTNFTSNEVFVPAGLVKSYPVVNQPCRECWGDECDEMKAAERKTDTVK